ncbi:glucose 1-dehydrogenase [Microbacterium sp. LWH7-1.2]|uniref:glucose 1-dehydrogenase n=1 Tax=Microbacterium sp. LWH7-1.2 TaxID=3135257 RepID=UPI0031392241
MTERLAEKVVVVTGAAQGMGQTHARRLVAEGALVVLADIDEEGTAVLARELGEAALPVRLDVTREADWSDALDRAVERFGRVDALINNAGLLARGDVDSTPRETWERVMNVNATGVYLGTAAVMPLLKAQSSGSIVNISSVDGLRGTDHLFAYTASKWAVTGMTKAAAMECAPWGIRVNSVHPGLILTPMSESLGPTRLAIPMGRGARPEEVSAMVAFLASDESAYCTGAEFVIDGGLTAGIPHRDPSAVA